MAAVAERTKQEYWEDRNAEEILKAADDLHTAPRNVRPCFVIAMRYRVNALRKGQEGFGFQIVGFLALECSFCGTYKETANKLLRQWNRRHYESLQQSKITSALNWAYGSNITSHYGCNHKPVPKHFCVGKENCKYYQNGRWMENDRRLQLAHDNRYETFLARGWPSLLDEAAQRMYWALAEFETRNKITPGEPLLYSTRAARETAGMRETRQRRSLETLEGAGLIEVVDWGKSGGKGKHSNPRTIRRIVPIPYNK